MKTTQRQEFQMQLIVRFLTMPFILRVLRGSNIFSSGGKNNIQRELGQMEAKPEFVINCLAYKKYKNKGKPPFTDKMKANGKIAL